ncbi:MAG: hypothetical protein J7M26_08295, partial [Armatimonadetes bacterium]|nr:hypothetical protein [Armatimonadota bacterium]
ADGRRWRVLARCEHGEAAQARGKTVVSFAPVTIRWLRIKQTGPAGCSGGLWWSIHELHVYGPTK